MPATLAVQQLPLEEVINAQESEDWIVEDLIASIVEAGHAPFAIPVWPVGDNQWLTPDHPAAIALIHAIEQLADEGEHPESIAVVICDDVNHALHLATFLPDYIDEDENDYD
jgi:hypothetical protein